MSPKISEILHNKNFLVHILPTGLILFAGIGATLWGYRTATETFTNDNRQAVASITSDIERAINNRLTIYEEIVRGGVGFYEGSDEVTHDDWAKYVNYLELSTRYPSLRGLGVVEVVPASELAAHEQKMKQNGHAQYQITPTSPRELYAPILFLEPLIGNNKGLIGYDVMVDPTRSAAMHMARDTAKAHYTDKLEPLEELDATDSADFIIFMPIYKLGEPTRTVQERRAAVQGYVFAPFNAQNFLDRIFSSSNDIHNVGLRIYANSKEPSQLVYENENYKEISKSPNALSSISLVKMNGVQWIIDYKISESVVSAGLRDRPINIIAAGFALTITLAALVFTVLTARSRAFAMVKEREIQSAKDNLLSLASHQLRTPATGVKQYVGMLIEGYAGELTDDQKLFLGKAYESNERQLQIINDLLYVAKAEAGRMILTKRVVDLSDLVKDVVGEQQAAISEKGLLLKVKVPKKPIMMNIDTHCIRMAIENLVSNAIKYTPEEGSIRVTVRKQSEYICVIVKDSGVGINRWQQKDLFKQFSRIPNALTQETDGSGIGLYLARHLVEIHGGTITVSSEIGKGSSFIIWLPSDLRVKAVNKK